MVRRITYIFLLLYFIFTLYTIISRHFGLPYLPFLTPFLTFLAFTFAVLHGSLILGWKRVILFLGLTFAVSLLFESVGVATGLIFGPYHYTEKLGPKLFNLVPFLIPLAWFMMSYPALIIAFRLVKPGKNLRIWHIGIASIGALIMTAWDLAMDPLMVASRHWVWDMQGAYFGIPLQNYWGWWLTMFVIMVLFTSWSKLHPNEVNSISSQGKIFGNLAVLSYSITGASTVIINMQTGLFGPGLVGIFVMSPWIIMAWICDQVK